MYNCSFCNNEYGTKKSLILHQKTAKFCLKIQKENEENEKNANIYNRENNTCIEFKCNYCEDIFTLKCNLERHYERCKSRQRKIKEENEQKKDELIFKLQSELHILMSQTYPERENKWKEELNTFKTENLVLKTELKMKDELNHDLRKEIESLKTKVDTTYCSVIQNKDKLLDTLIQKDSKSVNNSNNTTGTCSRVTNNNLTIHNYGIKPLTAESVINAFEAYNTKYKTAFFSGYVYNSEGISEKYDLEEVFYGIVRELKEYYGITDVSREKIIYNNNGEMTSTTIKDFIRTNIVMKNIDVILEWISNLKTLIFKRLEDGFTVTNEGEIKELTTYDRNQLKLKQDGLTIIYGMFEKSKERNDVNVHLHKYMSEGAMKYGITLEKKFNSLK